ncbi:MAG: family 10 glycosylhydrolase [Candidatus Bathyarchaeales archaeon]
MFKKPLIIILIILLALYPIKISKVNTNERIGIYYHPIWDAEVMPNNETLAKIKLWDDFNRYAQLGIQDVYFLALSCSATTYNSEISELYNVFDFDLLNLTCQIAQMFNISIHAWLDIRTDNPNWKTKSINGEISPLPNFAIPEFRQWVCNVISEIIHKYPVKGIHLDYVQYSSPDYSYDDYSLSAFYSETGINASENPNHPLWATWREEQIYKFMNECKITIKSYNLNLEFSSTILAPLEDALKYYEMV